MGKLVVAEYACGALGCTSVMGNCSWRNNLGMHIDCGMKAFCQRKKWNESILEYDRESGTSF